MTLAEARVKALETRRAIAQGRDPRESGNPTLRDAAERVIAIHSRGWKPVSKLPQRWRQSLRDHVYPTFGKKRVSEVTSADVLAVLLPLWHTKPPTAQAVRQRIGTVMKWAIAKGFRPDNPAGDAIGAALPKNGGSKHLAAKPRPPTRGNLARQNLHTRTLRNPLRAVSTPGKKGLSSAFQRGLGRGSASAS